MLAARVVATHMIPAGEGRIVTVPAPSRAGATMYLARNWDLSGDMRRGGCGYVVIAAPTGPVLVTAPGPGSGMVLWEVQIIEVDEAVPVEDRRSPADAVSAAFGGANLGDGLRRYLTMPLVWWALATSVGLVLGWRAVASIRAMLDEIIAAAPHPEMGHDSTGEEEEERWTLD